MFKGLLKDDSKTLRDAKVAKNAKLMMIAPDAKVGAVIKTPPKASTSTNVASGPQIVVYEPLCEQTKHKKILDKGLPDGAVAGHAVKEESLPSGGIVALLDNRGNKVRLAFKSAEQVLNIASADATRKVPYGSVGSVESEPIKGNEAYSIVGLKLGNGDASIIWLYYVPSQYVKALKKEIMSGGWL